MSDIVFAKGISFFKPHQNAPDFVIGNISIKGAELVPWLRENHKALANKDGYINLSVKMSKSGRPYVCVDSYKPKEEKPDFTHVDEEF